MLLRMSVTILPFNNVRKHFRFSLWLTLLHVIVYRFDLEQEISFLYNLCVRSAFVIVTSVFFVFFNRKTRLWKPLKLKSRRAGQKAQGIKGIKYVCYCCYRRCPRDQKMLKHFYYSQLI